MAQAVAIVGTGQTECGKRANVSYPELVREAVIRAFKDAGFGPDDIEAVVAGSMPSATEGVNNPHLYWADAVGARGKPLMRTATCGSTGISLAHTGLYPGALRPPFGRAPEWRHGPIYKEQRDLLTQGGPWPPVGAITP